MAHIFYARIWDTIQCGPKRKPVPNDQKKIVLNRIKAFQ